MTGRLPDVVLAGVPKAGTSAVASTLAARDDVHLPPDKEVHFFDEHLDRGLDWYRSQFPVDRSTVALDATPTYALQEGRFAELARTLPEALIVILLRHPVDRFWSAYWYLCSMGLEPRSMHRVIDEELAGTSRLPYDSIETGNYPPILEQVTRWYPAEQVLVLLHDDLRAEPHTTYRRLCAFVGLDPGDESALLDRQVNPTTTLRSYRLRHWSMRFHLFRRLPRLAHALDRWNRTGGRPPPLDAGVRRRLLEHYRPSIDVLETMLDRDLSAWRQ